MNLPGLALGFLLPVGLMMAAWGSLAPERSRPAANAGLFAMALAAVTFAAAGFAFQFGGIWHVMQTDAYRALDQLWSVPDPTGSVWSVIGLTGFMLPGASSMEIAALFLHQLPLVMAAVLIPVMALSGRAHRLTVVLAALAMAAIIAPLAGHWVWAGGALASLGQNVRLGHGYVDFGGAGPVYLAGGLLAVIGLALSRHDHAPADQPARLPEAHLPLLAVAGGILASAGWMGWATSDPLHPAGPTLNLAMGMMNVILGAAAGALMAQLYGWFATAHAQPVLAAQGWLAGLIACSAMAPFAEPRSALLWGGLAGLLTPLVAYAVNHWLRLDDATGAASVFSLGGLLGALGVGLWASGHWGAGWNGVGPQEYLIAVGQGVTGVFPAAELIADSGQLTAQLAGAGVIMAFALVVGGVVIALSNGVVALATNARGRQAIQQEPLPAAAPAKEE